jgi:hypothetical protein
MRTFSPAGMFEADDALNWEEMQHILRGKVAREAGFTYQMIGEPIQYDHAFADDGYEGDGVYPGGSSAHVYSDNAAINMYWNYQDMMNADSWDELKKLRAEHQLGK